MSGSRRAALLSFLAGIVLAAGAPAQKRIAGPYAVIAGTVFRDPGFALPGATVTLLRGGKKLQKVVSSPHGEFEFQVPPNDDTYLVTAAAKGYRPEQKEASISGEEHIEVNLTLLPDR